MVGSYKTSVEVCIQVLYIQTCIIQVCIQQNVVHTVVLCPLLPHTEMKIPQNDHVVLLCE